MKANMPKNILSKKGPRVSEEKTEPTRACHIASVQMNTIQTIEYLSKLVK